MSDFTKRPNDDYVLDVWAEGKSIKTGEISKYMIGRGFRKRHKEYWEVLINCVPFYDDDGIINMWLLPNKSNRSPDDIDRIFRKIDREWVVMSLRDNGPDKVFWQPIGMAEKVQIDPGPEWPMLRSGKEILAFNVKINFIPNTRNGQLSMSIVPNMLREKNWGATEYY